MTIQHPLSVGMMVKIHRSDQRQGEAGYITEVVELESGCCYLVDTADGSVEVYPDEVTAALVHAWVTVEGWD